MKNDLKIQLKRFDSGQITIKMFVENIRKISENMKDDNLSKDDIIQEYLSKLELEKQKKIKERNLQYQKKYLSSPEKRKRRSELDRKRYERNKAVGNIKN